MAADLHRLERMEVDESIKREIHDVIEARGWCIGGFAQVEFIMADFVLKAAQLPGYEDVATPFPFVFDSRLKRLRTIAERDGVLQPYSEGILAVAEAIEGWAQERHFFTHGLMDVIVDAGTKSVAFRLKRFMPEKGGVPTLGQMDFTLAELRSAGEQLSALAQQALKMFDDLYSEHGLEEKR